MKAKYYTAQLNVGMLSMTVKLGKPKLTISVSDMNLNWNSITLEKDQIEEINKFLNETPME